MKQLRDIINIEELFESKMNQKILDVAAKINKLVKSNKQYDAALLLAKFIKPSPAVISGYKKAYKDNDENMMDNYLFDMLDRVSHRYGNDAYDIIDSALNGNFNGLSESENSRKSLQLKQKVEKVLVKGGFNGRLVKTMIDKHFDDAVGIYPSSNPAKIADIISTLWSTE